MLPEDDFHRWMTADSFRNSWDLLLNEHAVPISGCENESRCEDVVFLHGLGGDAFATWRHGKDNSTSWPHWLGAEFGDVGIWLFGYAASPVTRFHFMRQLIRGFSK